MVASASQNKYDIAAETAEKELNSILDGLDESERKGAMTIFQWHARNFLSSGHKRLGRILVQQSKKVVSTDGQSKKISIKSKHIS